jgi:hypothetical protein
VEAINVAKIQPTCKDVRRSYRQDLSGPQQRAFDELGDLIDSPRDDLAWYHRVGQLVGRLRPEVPRGTRWSRRLAEALGPSPELLAKARRFAQLYPACKDVRQLEDMGVNWTRLYFAFAVPGRKDRHALLRRAVRERWSDQRLRFTVQQRFPSKRRGVGGRPRRPVTGHGPEVMPDAHQAQVCARPTAACQICTNTSRDRDVTPRNRNARTRSGVPSNTPATDSSARAIGSCTPRPRPVRNRSGVEER